MTGDGELKNIATRIGNQTSTPAIGVLTPDVRSGASFGYSPQGAVVDEFIPFFVVWFYTVEPDQRADFARAVAMFEGNPNNLPDPQKDGFKYIGTFAVSVSSAAPEFEYRTVWGLNDLAKLKELNDRVARPNPEFQSVLQLISPRPALRTEIMGRAKFARPAIGK